MKRFLFILLVFITLNSYAQNRTTDSLKQLLNTEIADTTRVLVLKNLARLYRETKPDTALILAQQGLALARQNGFVIGEAACLYSLGQIYYENYNYPKSLDYYLQALKLYESLQNQERIFSAIGNIGVVYSTMGDVQMAMSYYRKGKTLAESLHDTLALNGNLINLGATYEKLSQLDSARIYTNQAYELAVRLNNKSMKSTALLTLGNIHSKMQQDEIAMGYYRQSLSIDKEEKVIGAGCTQTLNMAMLFKEAGQLDSALHYARLSFTAAYELGDAISKLNACTFLSWYFKDLNRIDSAYYYQQITIAAKDSLFSQEKVREVQKLSFLEQVRQQEIEEAKAKAEEERKSNIQLLGIATFISFFFGLLFVFSKKNVNPKIINFLGLLGLLLLFEFISLFLHPYIAAFTHHKPIFMLLILVAIASLLVPVHHKLQGLVKEKLAQRTMNT